MPKFIEINAERQRVQKEPDSSFPVRTSLDGADYLRLLDRASRNGRELINEVRQMLVDVLDADMLLDLDTPTRDKLRSLSTIWKMEPAEAVTRLLSMTITGILSTEINLKQAQSL